MISARWRGGAGSSPLDGASTAASSPRMVHPTHWLISTQLQTNDTRRGVQVRQDRRRRRRRCWFYGRGPGDRGANANLALARREQPVVGPAGAQGLFVVRRGGQGRASVVAVTLVVLELKGTHTGEGLVARRALAFDQRGHAFARCCWARNCLVALRRRSPCCSLLVHFESWMTARSLFASVLPRGGLGPALDGSALVL